MQSSSQTPEKHSGISCIPTYMLCLFMVIKQLFGVAFIILVCCVNSKCITDGLKKKKLYYSCRSSSGLSVVSYLCHWPDFGWFCFTGIALFWILKPFLWTKFAECVWIVKTSRRVPSQILFRGNVGSYQISLTSFIAKLIEIHGIFFLSGCILNYSAPIAKLLFLCN